jgi:peroxiredoxin Q/BCP
MATSKSASRSTGKAAAVTRGTRSDKASTRAPTRAPSQSRPKASAKPPKGRAPSLSTLQPGSKAPAWKLAADSGKDVSLDDFKGRWLVLYFYPRDNTPGCTREAIAFRDAAAALRKRGAAVVGVSRDSIASHCKFRDQHDLSFTLLSDPTSATHAAYGAYGDKMMYGKKITGALRTTVLIKPDGKIGRIFSNVKVDGHDRAVLAAIDELTANAGP